MRSGTTPHARRRVGRPGDGEDVRGAILAATQRQLEATSSPGQVTVATIIDEAGCTPPSLYHYWSKREQLLREASAGGWVQFRASQSDAVADQHDPVERLRERGRGYLEFALAKPALFRVLFLEPPDTTTAGAPAEIGEALQDLVNDVTAAMGAGRLGSGDPLTTALALWSAVHGVAALWSVTPGLPTELARAVGDLAQRAVLSGLAEQPGAHPLDGAPPGA